MGGKWQILKNFVQVARTDLAGSAGPADRLGQADFLFGHSFLRKE